jgi:hypothetical protein
MDGSNPSNRKGWLVGFATKSSIKDIIASAPTLRAFVTNIPVLTQKIIVLLPLLISGCAISADDAARHHTADLAAAARAAGACRETIAAKSRYQLLATHLPLATILDATLPQMTATSFVNNDDVVALRLWLDDTRVCRKQLVSEVMRVSPTSLGVLVTAWNKDDEAFVKLATRKAAWGETIMKLRTNRADMLKEESREIVQQAQRASAEEQAELTRRVAVFDALTNLAP